MFVGHWSFYYDGQLIFQFFMCRIVLLENSLIYRASL
jgi:hypothetical protein